MAVDYQQNNVADLLQRGIAAATEKRKPEARQLLREVVSREPFNEQGWLWLAAVAESPDEAMQNFQQVLAINPNNQQAQAGLRWAEARRARTGQQGGSTSATSAPTTSKPPATFNTGNIAGPDAFGLPTSTSSRPASPDAFFTPPAGATTSPPPSTEPDLDLAALQRLAEARRNQEAQGGASSRQGFFEITDDDETPAPASAPSAVLADSTAMPSPAPRAALPDDYDDSFAGLDDLANIDDSSTPTPPRTEVTTAPKREPSVNLARQLAMEGAALDRKAGLIEGNPEDATSIEAAHANAARRRAGQSTTATRAASPGLFSSPMLAIAALVVALIVVVAVAWTMLGSNTSNAPETTIGQFLTAYRGNNPADYNKYLTSSMQKQISSDASIAQYLDSFGKEVPAATTATAQKIADDPSSGKPRVEYYILGGKNQPLLDIGLEKNGNDWQIFNIGWVGGKLASKTADIQTRVRGGGQTSRNILW